MARSKKLWKLPTCECVLILSYQKWSISLAFNAKPPDSPVTGQLESLDGFGLIMSYFRPRRAGLDSPVVLPISQGQRSRVSNHDGNSGKEGIVWNG